MNSLLFDQWELLITGVDSTKHRLTLKDSLWTDFKNSGSPSNTASLKKNHNVTMFFSKTTSDDENEISYHKTLPEQTPN